MKLPLLGRLSRFLDPKDPSRRFLGLTVFLVGCCLLPLSLIACAATFKGADLRAPEDHHFIRTEPVAAAAFQWLLVQTGDGARKFDDSVFEKKIQHIFYDSQTFTKPSQVFTDPSQGKVEAAYKLQVVLEIKEPLNSSSLLGHIGNWVSGVVTLTVIPFLHSRADYFMAVTVEKNSQVLKRYEYKHHMHTWIQFPFLAVFGPHINTTEVENEVEKEVMEDLLLVLRDDLLRDHVIVN